jgi:hypothetical protein
VKRKHDETKHGGEAIGRKINATEVKLGGRLASTVANKNK